MLKLYIFVRGGVTLKEYKAYPMCQSLNIAKLYSIFKNKFLQNHTSQGEKHDFWEYIYVDEGLLLIECDDKNVELKKGELYLHKPGEYHRHYVLNNEATLSIASFECMNPQLYEIADKGILVPPYTRMMIKESYEIANRIFKDIDHDFLYIRKDDYPIEYEQMLSNTIETIMLSLLCNIQEQSPLQAMIQTYINDEKRISELVITYLEKHIYDDIKIADVVRDFNICKTSLSQRFKNETGETIMATYNQLKIEKAKELMSSGLLSITDICDKLNYSSTQYFTKKFRKSTGFTPAKYQKYVLDNRINIRIN